MPDAPRPGLRDFVRHARDCREVRRLLRRYDSPNLRRLHWYGIPLARAASWRGIVRLVLWNLFRRRSDEIAGNYDLVNLYYADPEGDGLDAPAPPVWHCRELPTRPFFDGPSEVRSALEKAAPVVIEEFRKLAEQLGTHPDNASLMTSGFWSGLFLFGASGEKNEAVCALCPETARLVESLPLCRSFGFVMFSGLAPGSHVAAHCGSSNLRLRHHLGVEVPETEGLSIRVGRESRGWQPGGVLAFDDGYEHEVHHGGQLRRVVLVVDVWHPSLSQSDVECLSQPVFQRFGKVAART